MTNSLGTIGLIVALLLAAFLARHIDQYPSGISREIANIFINECRRIPTDHPEKRGLIYWLRVVGFSAPYNPIVDVSGLAIIIK